MPKDKTLSQAVFKSITESTYPEDENVISAELSSPALQGLSELLEQARTDVKSSISELSKLSATDVDGWIGQAKQLRTDIEESKKRSKEIVTFAGQGEELHGKAKEAASKVSFLRNEASFNDSLVTILKSVQELKKTADAAQQALQANELLRTTQLLNQSKEQLGALKGCDRTRLVSVVKGRLEDLQDAVTERLVATWNGLIALDATGSELAIRESIELGESSSLALIDIVESLNALNLLEPRIQAFRKELDRIILQPCLKNQRNGSYQVVTVGEGKLRLAQGSQQKLPGAFFADIKETLAYLNSNLPQFVVSPLAEDLVPSLVSRLLSGTLLATIPAELDGLPDFQNTLEKVADFGNFLDGHGWPGRSELLKWIQDAPDVWLLRRSQSSLHSVRQILKRGLGSSRSVERVETQRVSNQDGAFADSGKHDDWNAGWSDDEEEQAHSEAPVGHAAASTNGGKVDDDEDLSGWGFDEDEDNKEVKNETDSHKEKNSDQEEEEGDAWGWGDENGNQEGSALSPRSPQRPSAIQNAAENRQSGPRAARASSSEREITLKETYHITSLPEQILEIITMAVEDADALARADPASNPVASAARGLYSVPGHLLSMFRASAPNFYGTDTNGNMFMYNDCLYTAEQLRSFAQYHQSRNQNESGRYYFSLGDDIAALELFGKRAYGREMESQRTILTDFLDGAQGFANCTEPPFVQECETAISSTIDRVRSLHRQWGSVLSKSALLQSIGSLLVTATNKIIVDIEDMSDISEPESQRLTSFCNRITDLDDLFLPDQAQGADPNQQPIPLTAGYTSTWLKFQYLANILESSLIDIKYLWTEGELSLEFNSDEVVDLIEALFADSSHRKQAIQEIRRGPAR